MISAYHAKYYAHELTRRHAADGVDRLSQSLFDASVDLNPHQIEAALFALRNPLQEGVLLADEVEDGEVGERAVEQLRAMSGRELVFQTAVAVVRAATGFERCMLVPVHVRVRRLADAEIETYLRAEQPYDCAGSAKSEGLGVTLLEAMTSDDPTSLVGLPLIATCALLREAGLDALDALARLRAAAAVR